MIDIIDKNPEPLCECGKPRQKVFVEWAGKDIHSKWCVECEKKEAALAIENELREEKEVIARAIKREIEPIYYKASLCDFSDGIRKLVASRRLEQGVFIWGKTGTGKSHLASAMVKEFLMAGHTAKMVRFKDMVLSIRAGYDENKTEVSVLAPYIRCIFLSIEDIGTIKSGKVESDFCKDTLLTVIDSRIQREKPTVITTNLSPEQVWKSFGERIGSRISTFLTFKLEGRDRRLDK